MPPGVPETKEQPGVVRRVESSSLFLLKLSFSSSSLLNLHLHQFMFFIIGKDSLGRISHSLARVSGETISHSEGRPGTEDMQ